MIYSFQEFLNEKEIPLSASLDDYTVNDKGEGKFTVEIDGVEKQFSVLPVPKDIKAYEKIFFDLNNAINDTNPVEIYKALKDIEGLQYNFGNLFSTSLSLSNVKELALALTDTQRILLQTSESEFLKKYFSALPKETKAAVLEYLMKTAQLYAIVLESLFYFTRTGDVKKFFDGMDFKTILEEYQSVIDSCSEKHGVIYTGPYADPKNKTEIDAPVEYAYWFAEDKKSGKRWLVRGTVSPGDLNSEKNIIGKKGTNFTFLTNSLEEIDKRYTSFPAYELEKKVEEYIA